MPAGLGWVLLTILPVRAFSGEDPLALGDLHEGGPWHHAEMTRAACRAVGFSANPTLDNGTTADDDHARDAAAEVIAWHADYIDSYLYNPFFWAAGGVDRLKVALASYDELCKLHFDDLYGSDAIERAWSRYYGGTVCGLMWAAERGDVAAGRHILGVALHAVQDFYSHSNWVDDPARRNVTYSDYAFTSDGRSKVYYTGAYEHEAHLGIHHHGKFAPICSLLNNLGPIAPVMDLATSAVSPLAGSAIAEQWRTCQQGESVQPTPFGVKLPPNLVYLAPPGMALDSYWAAEIGARARGLTDITPAQAFETARDLAQRDSIKFLQGLERLMGYNGGQVFWEQLKGREATGRHAEYENVDRRPYQFLSAGPYPPGPPGSPSDDNGYYLRVRLRTSGDGSAGTDGDIYLMADGREFLLDYLPVHDTIFQRVLGYDDFEAGDHAVYTVGPWPTLPASISLENRAPTLGGVLGTLANDVARTVGSIVDGVGDLLLSVIGGHADFVQREKRILWPQDLGRVPTAPAAPQRLAPIELAGGGEGHYRLHASIVKVGESPDAGPAGWSEFQVRLDELECVEESDWDRGSNSDEPFVCALLIPLGSTQVIPFRSQPFDDVDDGERRAIGHTFPTVRLPRAYGHLSLAVALFESDDETAAARDALLDQFAGRLQRAAEPVQRNFIDALGSYLAAGWKLAEIEVYAFRRSDDVQYGTEIQYGTVLNASPDVWVEARRRVEFPLEAGQLWQWTPAILAPPGPGLRSAFFYAVAPDGQLRWYRHDSHADGSGGDQWLGPADQDRGWNRYEAILPGGGNVLYALTADGTMHWYRHDGFNTGLPYGAAVTARAEREGGLLYAALRPDRLREPGVRLGDLVQSAWQGPRVVGTGWTGHARVFGGGEGVVYTVEANGDLTWRRHQQANDGGGPETWTASRVVGHGWGEFAQLFGSGDGAIYAVRPDGTMTWYRHLGFLDGRGIDEGAWQGPVSLGGGWDAYQRFVPAGDGVFYAVRPDGGLRWFRHTVDPGTGQPKAGPRPGGRIGDRVGDAPRIPAQAGWQQRDVGSGWRDFRSVTALLPRQPDMVR